MYMQQIKSPIHINILDLQMYAAINRIWTYMYIQAVTRLGKSSFK